MLVSALTACGGSGGRSSSAPAPPSIPTTPSVPWNQWAFKGRVVETLTRTPIAGARLTFYLIGGVTREVVSSGDGAWEISQASSEVLPYVEVAADGYVTRKTYIRWNIGTREEIAIDLIKDTSPFSMSFYRDLVRNTHEKPEEVQPVWRLREAPKFYVNAFNPRSGREILPSELDIVTTGIRSAVTQLTGGVYEASIEVGTEDRPDTAGFITVRFVHEPESEYCGQAMIGADPGWIKLNYGRCQTSCGAFSPRTVAHEVGHSLGFFHVAEQPGAIMYRYLSSRECGQTTFSAPERYHANIAYQRPRWNRDPDWDPDFLPLFEPPQRTPTVVTCFH